MEEEGFKLYTGWIAQSSKYCMAVSAINNSENLESKMTRISLGQRQLQAGREGLELIADLVLC